MEISPHHIQLNLSIMNANITKFQYNENIVCTKVPYAVTEKYFTITDIGIMKFNCNTVKPYPCLKKICLVCHSLRCYLEHVKPFQSKICSRSAVMFVN